MRVEYSTAKSKRGFTLLEVILAITILSTLSLLSAQAIGRALKARVKIQAEIDDVSSLRDSMRMIRTDLNLAYHHRDFEQEINDLVTKKSASSGTPATVAQPATPKREAKREDPVTQFSGTDDQMNFVTMNNGRMTANSVQADFVEVGYSMKDCKNLTTSNSSKCLYRRVQTILDNDVTTGGNEVVMLENISEFKLRYFGDGKQDWANSWKSGKDSSDEVTKGKYPDAVEVSLTVEREIEKKKRTYSMQFVIPIHFVNNPDKTAPTAANAVPGAQPANPNGLPNGGL